MHVTLPCHVCTLESSIPKAALTILGSAAATGAVQVSALHSSGATANATATVQRFR
jgi:hypothetical protein